MIVSVLNHHSSVRILTVWVCLYPPWWKVLVAGRAVCLFAGRLTSAVSSFGLTLLPFWPFLMFHIKMHKNLNLTVTQLLLLLQNKTAPQVVSQKKTKTCMSLISAPNLHVMTSFHFYLWRYFGSKWTEVKYISAPICWRQEDVSGIKSHRFSLERIRPSLSTMNH